jgi:hypothetical protein
MLPIPPSFASGLSPCCHGSGSAAWANSELDPGGGAQARPTGGAGALPAADLPNQPQSEENCVGPLSTRRMRSA